VLSLPAPLELDHGLIPCQCVTDLHRQEITEREPELDERRYAAAVESGSSKKPRRRASFMIATKSLSFSALIVS
jgi:hypothetical protein